MSKEKPEKPSVGWSQEIADKITPIFEMVGKITAEDIEYLKSTLEVMEGERGQLVATQGVLGDYDKMGAKIKLIDQGQDRIHGLILIRAALDSTFEIQVDYATKKRQQQEVDKLLGI